MKLERIQWNDIQSKTVRTNYNNFVIKDLWKAVIDRSHLRNKLRQNRTRQNWHK